MCILFLCYQPVDPDFPYVLIAADNRDEDYERRTAPAAFWKDRPNVLAGRDIHKGPSDGGTWLGVSRNGRFGVLTNYRSHISDRLQHEPKSRGHLVLDFLLDDHSTPLDYSKKVVERGDDYNGFSLITATLGGSSRQMAFTSNKEGKGVQVLAPGIYGLSNQTLDSPWKKVVRGKEKFSEIVASIQSSTSKQELTDQLIELLCDRTCLHPDPSVPDTGHPEELVKSKNSIFVSSLESAYGTRSNTVVLVDRQGEVTFTERTMLEPIDPTCPSWHTNTFTFNI